MKYLVLINNISRDTFDTRVLDAKDKKSAYKIIADSDIDFYQSTIMILTVSQTKRLAQSILKLMQSIKYDTLDIPLSSTNNDNELNKQAAFQRTK
jgi:Txe/YoeB family toxin of Txe-Axe toxin-antitoxin module